MPIDYTTERGQVRLLTADVDEANLTLDDAMIDGYLALHAGSPSKIRRAAADALDAIATSEALVSKVIRTADGRTTDGAKVADALRKHAQQLRAEADQVDEDTAWDDDASGFGVTEFAPYPRTRW
jgi:hypothetical protein